MGKIIFTVLGSSGDHYRVTFEKAGQNVHAFCTCEAGKNGIYCKHRIWLMNGEFDKLISKNDSDLQALKDMMRGTVLERCYIDLVEAEEEFQATKRRLDSKKKALARAMYR
jgi:uncharacterized Zn finger protein